ncbi:hypothetical protein F5Y14DRAFT_395148 [Nemania sp. NC0429]|nr:hypothetical protein F5Y14DRAFT_395148 [Nemania sp. NC0429]
MTYKCSKIDESLSLSLSLSLYCPRYFLVSLYLCVCLICLRPRDSMEPGRFVQNETAETKLTQSPREEETSVAVHSRLMFGLYALSPFVDLALYAYYLGRYCKYFKYT